MERETFLGMLLELLDFDDEEEQKEITEDTSLDELEFDSISKLGILALLDTYAKKKTKVEDLVNCKKVKDIIDLVYAE